MLHRMGSGGTASVAAAAIVAASWLAPAQGAILYDEGHSSDGGLQTYDLTTNDDHIRIYGSFTVPTHATWAIESIYGHIGFGFVDFSTVSEARYEIRSGMSESDEGLSLASGILSATVTDAGYGVVGGIYAVGIVEVVLDSPLALGAGDYWVSLTPRVASTPYYLATTDGTDAINAGATASIRVENGVLSTQGGVVLGMTGTQTLVPEPASLALLALGAATAAGRRRRHA